MGNEIFILKILFLSDSANIGLMESVITELKRKVEHVLLDLESCIENARSQNEAISSIIQSIDEIKKQVIFLMTYQPRIDAWISEGRVAGLKWLSSISEGLTETEKALNHAMSGLGIVHEVPSFLPATYREKAISKLSQAKAVLTNIKFQLAQAEEM